MYNGEVPKIVLFYNRAIFEIFIYWEMKKKRNTYVLDHREMYLPVVIYVLAFIC